MSKMLRIMALFLTLFVLLSLVTKNAWALRLYSESFSDGDPIPVKFTCQGQGISPELHWDDLPKGKDIESIALIMDDPDAPDGTFTHWMVYNITPGAESLAEGTTTSVPNANLGLNSEKKASYIPPCPPLGPPHRYHFKLYALSIFFDYDEPVSRFYLLQAMQGHTLDTAELTGTYQKNSSIVGAN